MNKIALCQKADFFFHKPDGTVVGKQKDVKPTYLEIASIISTEIQLFVHGLYSSAGMHWWAFRATEGSMTTTNMLTMTKVKLSGWY